MIEEPGGYERDAGTAFGVLTIKPHGHAFRLPGMWTRSADGKNLYDNLLPRCTYCQRTRREIEEAEKR